MNIFVLQSGGGLIDFLTTATFVESGWTTTRHYEVPTHDIPISSIPEVLTIFNTQIQPLLKNLIQFNFSETEIIIHDAFIVKYEYSAEGGGNTGLPMHYDQSEYSFTVGLNEGFEGGGTFIRILEKVRERVLLLLR